MIVIANKIQTVADAFLVRWMYLVNPECCCLNSNTLLHTYIYIYIYIYLLCMCDIILTISRAMIFIFLDLIQPHEIFAMNVKCLSLKCLSKIIVFHISYWLIDNSVTSPALSLSVIQKYCTLMC